MNYKKLITSRKMRLKVLNLLNWVSDEKMLQFQYFIKFGRRLNLKNPNRYTEKMQWYKLYYKDSVMVKCVDKYKVREYVESKGLGNILNDLYGVYNSVNDIKFQELPNQFVLKATNGSGANEILICKDKENFNIKNAINKMKSGKKIKKNSRGREWVYYRIKPRIVIEKFIKTEDDNLTDYKFLCFNGTPYYLYVMNSRELVEEMSFSDKSQLGIFDLEYKQLPYFIHGKEKMMEFSNKPENFEKMIDIAKKLSADFPHVRVDLYNVKGKIIFGELTFYDASGYHQYESDQFDFILGGKFKLPDNKNQLGRLN